MLAEVLLKRVAGMKSWNIATENYTHHSLKSYEQ